MKTVHKYSVRAIPEGDYVIPIPSDFSIVEVGAEGDPNEVTFWALLDPDVPPQEYTFRVFGTGSVIPENYLYVGTANLRPFGIPIVWHLFRRQ